MYDESFTLREVTLDAYVPKVMISASAICYGTSYEGYNLVGNRAAVDYNDISLFSYWCTDNISIIATNESTLKTAVATYKYAIWEHNGSAWVEKTSTGLTLASYITVSGTPKKGDAIVVVSCNGVLLPNNVSQNQVSSGETEARASTNAQFDTPLDVLTQDFTPSSGDCSVVTDPCGKHAWVVFGDAWTSIVSGEDFIEVVFPVTTVSETAYTNEADSSAAALDAEVVA